MTEELRQMRAVDAIVQTVVSSPDDIVYISGSLIEGFGNQASDIDVFLITAGEPQYRGPFGSVLGDYYLDLEVYTREGMQALASRINALDVSDYRAVWLTPLADLDLYYRTLIGEARHNPTAFKELRADFSRDVIERLLATWCGLRYAISLQQAREELDAGRSVNAALAGQAAMASALDAYLTAHGEAFPSLKWRFEKLARLHGTASDLYARAWALKAAGSRDAGAYLEDVAEFGTGLGMGVYAAWTLDDVPLQKIGESRSYEIAGDAYIVQSQRFVYSVAPELREVFDFVEDGSTRATLRRELGGDGEHAREAIASLQSRALLRSY
jgi:hypothetical protein